MKKIVSIIICVIVLLYAVSIGAIMELCINAMEEEFHNSNYFFPATHETDIAKQYTDGKITFEDLANAMSEYDTRDLRTPYTCYLRFMDSAGNFISEGKCILKLKLSKGIPAEVREKYIDIDKYLTEDFKKRYAEELNHIESVELYRENYEFTPVAINIVWHSDDETQERVVLTDLQPNVICTNDFSILCWEQGDEYLTAEIFDTPLYEEKNDIYNYFKSMADGYSDLAKNGPITPGVIGGGGRLEGHRFIEYDYSVLNVSIGSYTYYTFKAVGVNLLEAVFDDHDLVKMLIAVTVIYLLIGTAACGATIFIFKREYE